MGRLAHELRRRFKTPEAAMKALGLSIDLLTADGRIGKDEEMVRRRYAFDEGYEEQESRDRKRFVRDRLRKFADDEEMDPTEVLETLMEHADPNQISEMMRACREIAEDRRGGAAWARDRRQRRAADALRSRNADHDRGRLGSLDRNRMSRDTEESWGPYAT